MLKQIIKISIFLLTAYGLCGSSYPFVMAKMDIEILGQAIDLYRKDFGVYPDSDGLSVLVDSFGEKKTTYLRRLPKDPWGNWYKYVYPSKYGAMDFDLYSFGANGNDDFGKVDDISNWAGYDPYYYPVSTSLIQYVVLVLGLSLVALMIYITYKFVVHVRSFRE